MTSPRSSPDSRRLTLPRRMRLSQAKQFEALRRRGLRAQSGPLSVSGLANDLPHLRYGLSLPRRVGPAVKRARIKRLIRESLRLMQHELPGGYDLLINVRPHETLALTAYQHHLSAAIDQIDRTWRKHQSRANQ